MVTKWHAHEEWINADIYLVAEEEVNILMRGEINKVTGHNNLLNLEHACRHVRKLDKYVKKILREW